MREKKKFRSKSVIIITIIVSLHYKETNSTVLLTNQTVLFTFLLNKSGWKIKLGDLKVIKSTLPNKSENPESLEN